MIRALGYRFRETTLIGKKLANAPLVLQPAVCKLRGYGHCSFFCGSTDISPSRFALGVLSILGTACPVWDALRRTATSRAQLL